MIYFCVCLLYICRFRVNCVTSHIYFNGMKLRLRNNCVICWTGKYQTALGSHCANCKGSVQPVSLGKYCVRFGYDIKQFCCSTCLEEFKKGLKVCSYCQKDISNGAEGFLAPVGDKGQFKVCIIFQLHSILENGTDIIALRDCMLFVTN
jgi:hypothetical protein